MGWNEIINARLQKVTYAPPLPNEMRDSGGDGEDSCLLECDAVWFWYIGAGSCGKALLAFFF